MRNHCRAEELHPIDNTFHVQGGADDHVVGGLREAKQWPVAIGENEGDARGVASFNIVVGEVVLGPQSVLKNIFSNGNKNEDQKYIKEISHQCANK